MEPERDERREGVRARRRPLRHAWVERAPLGGVVVVLELHVDAVGKSPRSQTRPEKIEPTAGWSSQCTKEGDARAARPRAQRRVGRGGVHRYRGGLVAARERVIDAAPRRASRRRRSDRAVREGT